MMNALILLFQCYLQLILYHSGHISHYKIDFVKVQFKDSWSGAEVKTTFVRGTLSEAPSHTAV